MDQFHPTADVAIHAELQKNAQDNSRKSENLESRIDLLEKKYSKLSDDDLQLYTLGILHLSQAH